MVSLNSLGIDVAILGTLWNLILCNSSSGSFSIYHLPQNNVFPKHGEQITKSEERAGLHSWPEVQTVSRDNLHLGWGGLTGTLGEWKVEDRRSC